MMEGATREIIENVVPKETAFDKLERQTEFPETNSDKVERWLDGLEDGTVVLDEVPGLKSHEKLELTDAQKLKLKEDTGWPDVIINSIRSLEEAQIYIDAGLKHGIVDGKDALIRDDIDFDSVENIERLSAKPPLSPVNRNGEVVELHHIGQNSDSPLAELTFAQHQQGGNKAILHDTSSDYETQIDRNTFDAEKKKHWENRKNGT